MNSIDFIRDRRAPDRRQPAAGRLITGGVDSTPPRRRSSPRAAPRRDAPLLSRRNAAERGAVTRVVDKRRGAAETGPVLNPARERLGRDGQL